MFFPKHLFLVKWLLHAAHSLQAEAGYGLFLHVEGETPMCSAILCFVLGTCAVELTGLGHCESFQEQMVVHIKFSAFKKMFLKIAFGVLEKSPLCVR